MWFTQRIACRQWGRGGGTLSQEARTGTWLGALEVVKWFIAKFCLAEEVECVGDGKQATMDL